MAADITPDFMQGLCVPWPMDPSHLWASESSYTEQDPLVGQAQPLRPMVQRLETSGRQSSGGSLRIRTQRAGHPGPEGSAFIWKNTADAETQWRGRDIQALSAIETVRHTTDSGVDGAMVCDAESLPDGTVMVAYLLTDGSDTSLRLSWRKPGVTNWTEVVIQDGLTADDWAALAFNPLNGAVYCCHWIADGQVAEAQVRTHRITYNKADETWSSEVMSRWSLETPLSTDPTIGYRRKRLRMAFNKNGQLLLVGWVVIGAGVGALDHLVQYASTSEGGLLKQVAIGQLQGPGSVTVPFCAHSVLAFRGKFYVIWPARVGVATVLYSVNLPHAYSSIVNRWIISGAQDSSLFAFQGSSGQIDVVQQPSNIVTVADCSVWIDEEGTFRLAALYQQASTQDTPGNGYAFMMQSVDAGKTWKYCGDGDRTGENADAAIIINSGDGDTYPTDFVGVSQVGRQVLFTNHVTPDSSTDLSVHAVYFGGSSTLELPGRVEFPRSHQRHGFESFTYLPVEQPEFYRAITAIGSGTDVIDGVGLQVATSGSSRYYEHTLTGDTIAGGILFDIAYRPTIGGSTGSLDRGVTLRSADGTNDYSLQIRKAEDGFQLYDGFLAAPLVTVNGRSGDQEIRVAMAGGQFFFWYRDYDPETDRVWLSGGVARTLLDNPGTKATSSQIRVGHISTGTANTRYFFWAFNTSGGASALKSGQTNPTDLIGRDYPRRGRAVGVDDGARISTLDGSAREGDEYQIDASALHPIDRSFFRKSPTPRVQWRSARVTSGAVPEQTIALKLNNAEAPVSTVDPGLMPNQMAFVYLDGINFSRFEIQGYTDAGAWVTIADVDTAISARCDLRNNVLYASQAGRVATFTTNECIDWTARVNSQINVRVLRNSEGLFGGPRQVYKQAVLTVEGATGDAYVGDTELIPNKVLVIFQIKDIRYRAFRLRILAQETYHRDFRIGVQMLGHVSILATPTSRGRIIEQIPGTITEDDLTGVRRWVDIDPGGRFLRIAWVDPVIVSAHTGTQANDLDYYVGSDQLGSDQPIASAWRNEAFSSVPFDLQGLFKELGAGQPVVFAPRITKATSVGEEVRVFTRQQQFFFGQLDGSIQIESVLGYELAGLMNGVPRDELFRVATLPLREVR